MSLNNIFYRFALFFFLLMLVIPTTHQAERGLMLSILLMGNTVYLAKYKCWRMNNEVAFVGFLCVSASVFYMLNGALHSAPSVLTVGSVYLVWPLLFLFILGTFNYPLYWFSFLKVIIVGCISAAAIGILAVSESLGFFDFGLITLLGEGTRIGIGEDTIGFSMPNLVTVIYALPFLLSLLMLPKEYLNLKGWWLVLVWFAFLLAAIVLIIAGRRAFWVSSAVAPFFMIFFSMICNVKIKLKNILIIIGMGAFLAVVATLFLGINFDSIWDDFVRGFDFSDVRNEDAFTRKEQFQALLHGWYEAPIIGAGHGGGANEFIRDADAPFDYELSYMSLLFHTGLSGVIVYGSSVIWLFLRSAQLVRRKPEAAGMLIPLLTGLICFLIANISNPYMEKFDYLWTLFLPIAVLNAYLINSNGRQISAR